MLNETAIISLLQNAFPTQDGVGIGDDATILPLNDKESYVISKDILAEHKHFRLSYGDAASLAHKALHVNFSDMAAMGAVPRFVMLGIALPTALSAAWVESFLTAFAAQCKKHNVQLIGGDTTASERDLFISVTIIGRAEKTHLKFRSGAKVDDAICVAGTLGEAHAGLTALEKVVAGFDAVKGRSLCPSALVAEGAWLGAQNGVTAMMDISDGLHLDLSRLLKSSGMGAMVDLENLKPSPQLVEACNALKLNACEAMLAGGEDYALLMTVAPEAYDWLAEAFEKEFHYALMKVGTVTATENLELRDGGKPAIFTGQPFSHFGEL